ncbi:MAG: LON peptidase substrate-binding domain-containing protein [Hyphomicrobiales bacterium]|nr:LON peptidase substrate-binding domain-containing protein [Hyphomicrobiales bacterium]
MRLADRYKTPKDVPEQIPVFPLVRVLLLPRAQLPLNIFEPRYLAMIDAVLAGDRIIGMVQPAKGDEEMDVPALAPIGTAGRITSLSETQDGRYLITLTGICRFRIEAETTSGTPYRTCRIACAPFVHDLEPNRGEGGVDRERLLELLRAYLDSRELEVDWQEVHGSSTESLVNALSILSPYGPDEKQALLEAPDLRTRAEILIALTEMALGGGESGNVLQ